MTAPVYEKPRITFKRQKRARNSEGRVIGEDHHLSKYSNATVDLVRELREDDGLIYREIAERTGVDFRTVIDICKYRSRADVAHEWR